MMRSGQGSSWDIVLSMYVCRNRGQRLTLVHGQPEEHVSPSQERPTRARRQSFLLNSVALPESCMHNQTLAAPLESLLIGAIVARQSLCVLRHLCAISRGRPVESSPSRHLVPLPDDFMHPPSGEGPLDLLQVSHVAGGGHSPTSSLGITMSGGILYFVSPRNQRPRDRLPTRDTPSLLRQSSVPKLLGRYVLGPRY